MRIGRYQVSAVETGRFALDGGAMFGVVPKTLWEKQIPADDKNRIPMALRTLLIEEVGGTRKILVDTGMGSKWSDKMAAIYAVDHSQLTLEKSLQQKGLTTDDITDVLLTHFHFDHAGGATRRDERGKLVPSFARARYWVQRRNLELARAPSEKDRASYLTENFTPLLEHGVLQFLDGPGPWAEGIELVLSDGHTLGMQLPRVFGPEGSVIYCADLIPTAAHVPVPWVMAYDNQPVLTIQEKKPLLAQAHEQGWVLFFEHDPYGPAARVQLTDKGYSAGDRVVL